MTFFLINKFKTDMLKESKEAYLNRLKQYVFDVVEAEKRNLPGAKKMKDKITWDIIQVASNKAMKHIYEEFEKDRKSVV